MIVTTDDNIKWMAFNWTTNPETCELFEFLNPTINLPSWYVLSNRILNNERVNFITSREQKLKEDSIGVTLAFDGWKNILNQNIFGLLFILSTREVQIWEAIDTSSEREKMVNIIPKIENMINDASQMRAK